MPHVYPPAPPLDQIMNSLPDLLRYRYGPSVTFCPRSLPVRLHAASLPWNMTRGSPAACERSSFSGTYSIVPFVICTHSWQNTMYGTPSSTQSVPSSVIMSGGGVE